MKIGLCGTMSVGKTTLVNALKEIPQFKDYAIATERSKYLNSLGIPLNHKTTIEGQTIFLAERVTELWLLLSVLLIQVLLMLMLLLITHVDLFINMIISSIFPQRV